MSTTRETAAGDSADASTEFKYVVLGTSVPFDRETRHEAVGELAIHDGADRVVPIAADCLGRQHRNPVHLGNKHYGDRRYLATTHGAVRIDREDLVRFVNDTRQDVVETTWTATCPDCHREHSVDGAGEDARSELIDEVLECCDDVEWFPPSDWVENCEICGSDHRGAHNCEPPAFRDPFPGVDETYRCAACGWDGDGEELQGPNGECPDCDSPAVQVIDDG